MGIAISVLQKCVSIVATKNSNVLQLREHCEQSINLYIETSVRNKCRCSFYCALLTLHVSAPYTRNRMHNPIIKIVSNSSSEVLSASVLLNCFVRVV
jgi:hypothetical protein